MHPWDAISYCALRDTWFSRKEIKGEDPGYFLRKVFRWYSEKFATPLHLVSELPLEAVLRAHFESRYEGMEDPDLEDLVRTSSISDKKQLELDLQEDRSNAFDFEDIRDTRIENANVAKRLEDVVPKVRDALQEMVRQARGGGGKEAELIPTNRGGQLPSKLPPSIRMTFVSEEELERELNKEEGLGGPLNLFPKSRK